MDSFKPSITSQCELVCSLAKAVHFAIGLYAAGKVPTQERNSISMFVVYFKISLSCSLWISL